MYETFFQFRERPFVSTPCPQRYFPATAIEHARQTMIRCVECSLGPGLVIGPAGTGKSLLCQSLAEQFRNTFSVAMLANSKICSRRALLQSVLFELDLPYRDLEEGELRLSLMDFLEPSGGCHPNGMLLIVDEAHTLPMRLLEEIRMITNLVRHGQPRVRLFLAGGMALEERFASPKLESFNQRLAARCYLQPFTREETANYVRAQIAAVGGDAEQLFDEAALRAIFTATDGIPRLINQVCDYALLLASVANHRRLNAAVVEEAWADLQQLPLPFPASETAAPVETNIIEFGQLRDEPVATALAAAPVTRQDRSHDQFAATMAANTSAQLDHIERGVAAVRATDDAEDTLDDFGYAAFTAVPEASAAKTPVARTPANPFGDGFDEEEIVLDHYASLETRGLRNRPRVSSVEGRELGAALRAAEPSASRPSLAIAEHSRSADLTAEELELLTGESDGEAIVLALRDVEAGVGYVDPANDPVLPELEPQVAAATLGAIPVTPALVEDERWHSFVTVATTTQDFGWPVAETPLDETNYAETKRVEPPHVESRRVEPLRMRVVPIDDRDLIVVDQDSPAPQAPARPAPQTRRQEYRQLFAKLRRG